MKTYPIMLDVKGRLAVVVGGGQVGLRKARKLLDAGARVRLAAPDLPLQQDPPAGGPDDDAPVLNHPNIEIIRWPYDAKLLDSAFLVFACTPDRTVNSTIAADARRLGILVNVADQPQDCDFLAPAVFETGDIQIAVGTGGSCPGLAAMLRQMIADALPERIDRFAALLAGIREELKAKIPDQARRSELIRQLACREVYDEFVRRGMQAVRDRLALLVWEIK
ncbi:MAG: bifunctional precorrin-2 dehydrogenase/sirohydrochlorin ferrochelatase [Planctomycetes bacterium]|nr:bifunctional precorrin-2 dehydrogenase/sirohydrochlorin ferrochelatase [Planctomycetota bacterium]